MGFWVTQKPDSVNGQRGLTAYIFRSTLDLTLNPVSNHSPQDVEQIQNIKYLKQLTHKDLPALTYGCQTTKLGFLTSF